MMIIELKDQYDGFKKYEHLFYKDHEEKKKDLELAEKIAYEQLKEELKKYGHHNLIANVGAEHANYTDGGVCICREDEYWLVYYSERYSKSELSVFTSPYSAVNFYLWSVLSNPSKENTSIGRIPKLGTF